MIAPWVIVSMLASTVPASDDGSAADPQRAAFHEETVVVATRSEVAADRLPVDVAVLGRDQIQSSAAHTMDDVLRQIPSFQLLREQSSEVSPIAKTSVAFRGLTGTSASRALVLLDGIPINDPFQGYVRWSQVPIDNVERIEVVRGGSVVWGNLGIGGTINIVTRPRGAFASRLGLDVGERSRGAGTLSARRSVGAAEVTLRGSYQGSGGYYRLAAEDRGPVDLSISSETSTAGVTIDLTPSASHRIRLQGGWFGDERDVLVQTERERTGEVRLSVGGDLLATSGDAWSYHAFATQLDFASFGVRTNGSRTVVTPNRDQYDVPAAGIGADLQWARQVGGHELAVGGDSRWTEGEVDERSGWDGSRFTTDKQSGGTQILSGVYAQDLLPAGERWTLYGALRWDRWESTAGFREEHDLNTGAQVVDTRFATRTGSVVSPSLGATVRIGERSLGRVAAYGGFRAPTLNELYKPVTGPPGTIESNPAATPEKLRGAEVGWQFQPRPGSEIAAAAFHTEVDGMIQNVTIGAAGSGPELIEPCGTIPAGLSCRQRQNVGKMRSQGLELSASWRSARGIRLFGSGVRQHARIISAPAQPQLVGKRVEQAPDWVVNLGIGGPITTRGSFLLSHRWVSDRYDDDLEALYVGELRSLDLSLGWQLRRELDVALKVVNVLDRRNPVGVTAARPEVGAPRLVSVALRWSVGPRRGR